LGLLAGIKDFQRIGLLEQDKDLLVVRRLPGYPPLLQKLQEDRREARRAAKKARREEEQDEEGDEG